MKTLLVYLALASTLCLKAQFVITATANPVAGDVDASVGTNTAGLTIPVSGTNKLWNYSGLTLMTNAISSATYVPFSAIPNNNLFPGGTIGLSYVGGYTDVYKVNASVRELVGAAEASTANCLVLSDPIIFLTLPFGYGSGYYDTFGFTDNGDVISGGVSLSGSGTGTLMLPGSITLNNVLKVTMSYTQTETTSSYTSTSKGVQHMFYSSVNKFPLLTISTSTSNNTQTPTVFTNIDGSINKNFAVGVGIEEQTSENNFSVFPNPVSAQNVTITFISKSELTNINLLNTLGQVVKENVYNNLSAGENKISFDLKNIPTGIYYLQIKTGEYEGVKKLVIE
jgi:hypothetical protein